jgi:hypothetical protein
MNYFPVNPSGRIPNSPGLNSRSRSANVKPYLVLHSVSAQSPLTAPFSFELLNALSYPIFIRSEPLDQTGTIGHLYYCWFAVARMGS